MLYKNIWRAAAALLVVCCAYSGTAGITVLPACFGRQKAKLAAACRGLVVLHVHNSPQW